MNRALKQSEYCTHRIKTKINPKIAHNSRSVLHQMPAATVMGNSGYDQLPQIPKDEPFYGTERILTDPHGGFIENPLVSDVQDEAILAKLVERGLGLRDAQHHYTAICNSCDVFLTRDEDVVIKPHRH